MLYIAHRINTAAQLAAVPPEYGIELDLRDDRDRVVLQHDPFVTDAAEDFEEFLAGYRHRLLIANVKSERIEHRVAELLQRYGVADYFFLDSSFPMMRLLASKGETRQAVRFSEYEPIEYALAMAGKVDWVWVDCFTRLPLDEESYAALKEHFRICIVSPELQGHGTDRIAAFADQLRPFDVDAVCTKRPELWQAARGSSAEETRQVFLPPLAPASGERGRG